MAFLVNEAYLPATFTVGPMTDEAFAQLCAEHSDLNFELSADGELLVKFTRQQARFLTRAQTNPHPAFASILRPTCLPLLTAD